MEKAKSWLPSMFQRSKHAAKQKEVMKKLKNNLRYAAYWNEAGERTHRSMKGRWWTRHAIVSALPSSCVTPCCPASSGSERLACLSQRGAAAGIRAGLPRVQADLDTCAGKSLLSHKTLQLGRTVYRSAPFRACKEEGRKCVACTEPCYTMRRFPPGNMLDDGCA